MKEPQPNHFGFKEGSIRFLITAAIVIVIIGEILWDPENFEGETQR